MNLKALKREKFWKELNSEEKIDRMRSILKGIQNTLDYVEKNSRQTSEDFKNHEHTDRNGLVKPLNAGFGGGELSCGSTAQIAKNPDEVYF